MTSLVFLIFTPSPSGSWASLDAKTVTWNSQIPPLVSGSVITGSGA